MSAASYEARRFGIHSAMSLREAYRRCPDAVFLPVDGRRYQAASRDVMAILRRYTPLVEPISIDEAFLDVTGSAALFGDGPTIARRIKDDVAGRGRADRLGRGREHQARGQDRVGPAQAGRAGRRAARRGGGVPRAAPDRAAVGRRREDRGRAARVLRSGRSATWRRCRRTSSSAGSASTAASLVDRARGIDADPVHDGDPAKSVGHEHTFDVDTSDPRSSSGRCWRMADGVAGRLRSAGVRAGTVAVKIRDSGFRTITRQRTLAEPTDLTEPIYATALELARPEIRGMRVRLLGRHRVEPRRARAAVAVRQRPSRGSGGRSRRPMRSAGGTARGRSPGRGCSGRGCRRRSSATRATRSIGGRGACRPTPTRPAQRPTRAVTAKVTRTSTRFRPTTLDIEHLFGLRSTSQPNRRSVGRVPRTTRPSDSSPRKGAISNGIHPSRTGPGPGPDRLVQRSSA